MKSTNEMSSVINLSTRDALLGWLKDSSSCLNGQSDSLNEKVTIDHLLNSYSDVESLMFGREFAACNKEVGIQKWSH